jgi:hypothetical protein
MGWAPVSIPYSLLLPSRRSIVARERVNDARSELRWHRAMRNCALATALLSLGLGLNIGLLLVYVPLGLAMGVGCCQDAARLARLTGELVEVELAEALGAEPVPALGPYSVLRALHAQGKAAEAAAFAFRAFGRNAFDAIDLVLAAERDGR